METSSSNSGKPAVAEPTASIAQELLQLLTPDQATDYALVPYRREGGLLVCYGASGRDYNRTVLELEVLSGLRVRVTAIPEQELEQLLQRCYRTDRASGFPPGNDPGDGCAGQEFLPTLLGEAVCAGASDIHLEPYESSSRIRLRIDGKLTERYVLDRRRFMPLVNRIKILSNLDVAQRRQPQQGRIRYECGEKCFEMYVSTLPTVWGEKVVLHLVTRRAAPPALDQLGFSERQYADYCRGVSRRSGLVLVCGPAGSGKRTTLYATLQQLNRSTDNILTIEDPVVHTFEGINQVQLEDRAGLTYAGALQAFLGQDPDVILLGGIHDASTARMAVHASMAGRLLLSTLHANTAWGAVMRLVDLGVQACLVADTLVTVVAQRLIRLLCPHCKREVGATSAERSRECGTERCFEPVGCERCFNTGYSGRRAVYEVIPMDAGFVAAARRGASDIGPLLRERGIRTLRESAVALFLEGLTSLDEITPLLH